MNSEGNRPTNGEFEYNGHRADIRWSSFIVNDTPEPLHARPAYCVVQINNVFNNPAEAGVDRWVSYQKPQVVFQFHDGLTGEGLYAESIVSQ
jgi:hypothetical protein